jgi:hypothetical protein
MGRRSLRFVGGLHLESQPPAPALTRNQTLHPQQERPRHPPAQRRLTRRPPTRLRPRDLQAAPRRRVRLQPRAVVIDSHRCWGNHQLLADRLDARTPAGGRRCTHGRRCGRSSSAAKTPSTRFSGSRRPDEARAPHASTRPAEWRPVVVAAAARVDRPRRLSCAACRG